jgi:hypothetical protein
VEFTDGLPDHTYGQGDEVTVLPTWRGDDAAGDLPPPKAAEVRRRGAE